MCAHSFLVCCVCVFLGGCLPTLVSVSHIPLSSLYPIGSAGFVKHGRFVHVSGGARLGSWLGFHFIEGCDLWESSVACLRILSILFVLQNSTKTSLSLPSGNTKDLMGSHVEALTG